MPSTLTLQEIWPRTLAMLQDTLKRKTLAKWVPDLQPVSFDGATLVVSAPTQFVQEWMAGKAAPLLSRKLSDELDTPIAVQFTIGQLSLKLEAPEAPAKSTKAKAASRRDDLFSSLPLNPRYTFDQYVAGKHSHMAHAAAQAVSRKPGKSYNPLFVYGGVGLGKTHLMQAIGHAALREDPALKVCYVSGDTFTYHVVTSIREDRFGAFRDAYRDVDLWLVDDIQFIASKERTEAEFFQVFNTLIETGKQVVISADRAPKDLQLLDQRLRSRFEWGLMADIKAPDLETRIAILQKKAALENMAVPEDVIRYIASTITGNIRSLEGALIKVMAASSLTEQELCVSLAMEHLRDHSHGVTSRLLSIADVQQAVVQQFNIALADLTGARRTQNLVQPRQVAMYLCRQLLSSSFPEIARNFGGRDHSTVIYACTKMEEAMRMDTQVRAVIDGLTTQLQEAMSARE